MIGIGGLLVGSEKISRTISHDSISSSGTKDGVGWQGAGVPLHPVDDEVSVVGVGDLQGWGTRVIAHLELIGALGVTVEGVSCGAGTGSDGSHCTSGGVSELGPLEIAVWLGVVSDGSSSSDCTYSEFTSSSANKGELVHGGEEEIVVVGEELDVRIGVRQVLECTSSNTSRIATVFEGSGEGEWSTIPRVGVVEPEEGSGGWVLRFAIVDLGTETTVAIDLTVGEGAASPGALGGTLLETVELGLSLGDGEFSSSLCKVIGR